MHSLYARCLSCNLDFAEIEHRPIVFRLFIKLIVLIGLSATSLVSYGQTCPQTFAEESRSDTTLSCLFSANISQASTDGTPAHLTTEGTTIANQASNLCAAANGLAFRFSEGPLGVRVRCTLALDPPDDPPADDPPADDPPADDPPADDPPADDPPADDPPADDPPAADPPADPDPIPAPDPAPSPDPVDPTPEPINFDDADDFSENGFGDVATSLATVCSRFSSDGQLSAAQADLLSICEGINGSQDLGSQLNAVQQVAARQYSEIADLIGFQNSIQVGDVGSRLASIRPAMEQNARDVALGGSLKHPNQGLLASNKLNNKQYGGSAGDADSNSALNRWGMFLAFSGGDGEKDTTLSSSGFDYSSRNATIGVDYVVNSSIIAGLAIGYGDTDSDLFLNSGQIDIESRTISLYLSKVFNRGWFIDGVIGRGSVSTESSRNINFTVGSDIVSQTALADFDSDQNLLGLGVGKRFNSIVDIDFSARLNYIDTTVERFSEATNQDQLGFGLALEIDEQDISSFASDVSLQFSRSLSTNWGVLIPRLSLRWQHEFDRGEDALLGRFLSDPNGFDFQASNIALDGLEPTLFEVPLELIDTDYGSTTLGLTALLPKSMSISASVSQTVALNNFDHTFFSLLVRKDF